MKVPGSRYESSPRSMPVRPDAEAWYLEEDERRRVLSNGLVEFRGRRLWIGDAFAGHMVAFDRSEKVTRLSESPFPLCRISGNTVQIAGKRRAEIGLERGKRRWSESCFARKTGKVYGTK